MARSKTTTQRKKTPTPSTDAIALLKRDHKAVKSLFAEYETLLNSEASNDAKQTLASRICSELTVHAQVEEEIFYPALREALGGQDLLDEAEVEHKSAKDLIVQLEGMDPDEDLYDATVKVLGEYINHHVEEEEGEMFPQARKAGVDTQALGEEMSARREALLT